MQVPVALVSVALLLPAAPANTAIVPGSMTVQWDAAVLAAAPACAGYDYCPVI